MEEITKLQDEITSLRRLLVEKESRLVELKSNLTRQCIYTDSLSTEEVVRYSRQMILRELAFSGQKALKNSKVLIVGVGGLGCPAALYLTSAGIGEITLVDYDEVEISNLHRQILHNEHNIGESKVESAHNKLQSLNTSIKIIPLKLTADKSSLKQHLKGKKYDVILDCSDNVATRYLLNDFSVINHIPLVSGSALQFEGQLTVYNYENGPCYRCLFPIPPPPEAVTNCGDGGVLGPIPGTIGVLQALETIKIIAKIDGVLSGRLLLFDGTSTSFRTVKLQQRCSCAVCGFSPTITDLIDYEQFCRSGAHDKVVNIDVLSGDEHIDIEHFIKLPKNGNVIDVRPELEYEMCKLSNTVNVPYGELLKGRQMDKLERLFATFDTVYTLCRRGNDSQRTVSLLKEKYPHIRFRNIKGGLYEYARKIDASFPVY